MSTSTFRNSDSVDEGRYVYLLRFPVVERVLPFLLVTSPELSTVRGKEKKRERCFGLQLMQKENGLLQICTW